MGQANRHLPLLLKFPFQKLLVYALKSLLELVNTSANIDKLLLACEEGVALRANFNLHFPAVGGLGLHRVAACADNGAVLIGRMNSCFHDFYLVSNIPMFFDIVCKHSRLYHINSPIAIVF